MARWLVLLVFSSFLVGNSMAANKAGHVLLSLGNNSAQLPEQESRVLKRKSEIYTQDRINTGPKGRLQIRFTDNSRLSLRPDTQFQIEDYSFSSSKPDQAKSVYRLLKGGLRTITGAISDQPNADYQIRTPIATIGVRGTHYTLFYCDQTCKETTRASIGLYGYVLEGEIFIANKALKAPIQMGRYFFLGSDGRSLKIRKMPFKLFEVLQDMGPDLMTVSTDSNIPALDVNQLPRVDGTLDLAPNRNQESYP